MARQIRILSLDGGGIKGLIPAQVLVELEHRLQKESGRPEARVSDFFDFFAGTSTGGILTSLCLIPSEEDPARARYSAEDVVQLYEECGNCVFRSSLWQRLSSGGGFLYQKFDATGIEQAFLRYFGETRLKDLVKPCLITAFDIQRGKPHFFTQHDAKKREGHDFFVRDVARATSSAPTFFEVPLIRNDLGEAFPMIDGGVFANNPGLCAYAEVIDMFEHVTARDMVVLSLGTGRTRLQMDYEQVKSYGIVRWAAPLAEIMVTSVSEIVDYQLEKIFGAAGVRDQYLRIEPVLEETGLPTRYIDDASAENVAALKELGRRSAEEHSEALDRLVARLLHPVQEPARSRLAMFPQRLFRPLRAVIGGR